MSLSTKVHVSRFGYLQFRIYWQGTETVVGTSLKDVGKNKERLVGKAWLIDEKIEKGAPLYRALIDVIGECPQRLMPYRGVADMTVEQAGKEYLSRLTERGARGSKQRKAKAYINAVVIPYFGKTRLIDLDEVRIDEFQRHVLKRKTKWSTDEEPKTIAVKTAKNIVAGHFAALLAYTRRRYQIPARNLLDGLEWPEVVREEPDPFTSEERDTIIGWFAAHRPDWSAFVAFLFWSGLRQSEASGLQLGDVDLTAGTVSIRRSLGRDGPEKTKTKASRRTIALLPEALAAIASLPSRPWGEPEKPLFELPCDHEKFTTREWYPALARLGIRKRKFYATRHTFISWLLGQDEALAAIAQYCGTSTTMIEQSYGRWLPKGATAGVSSLRAVRAGRETAKEKAS
jgi:integrase